MSLKSFWKNVAKGTLVVIVIVGFIGLVWYLCSSNYVKQRGYQAKYLLVLSGEKTLSDFSQGDASMIKPLIALSESVKETGNPEQELVILLKGLETTAVKDPGSYIAQLVNRYPGEINRALQGDSSFAQKLWAHYLKTRGVKFYPFGMVLTILAFVGMLFALDFAAYNNALENYQIGRRAT